MEQVRNLLGMAFHGQWLTYGDVATFMLGKKANKTDGDIPIIGSGVKPVGFTHIANQPSGTITMAYQGSIGNVYRHDTPIFANATCLVITPKKDILADFLYHCLKKDEPEFKKLTHGLLIPRLDVATLKAMPFFLPNHEGQIRLLELLRKAEQFAQAHEAITQQQINRVTKQMTHHQEILFDFD